MEKLRVLLWTAPLTLGEFISCSFESRKRFEFTTVVQQGAAKANTSDSRMTKVSRLLKTAWVKHLLQFYCVLCVLCVLLSIEKQKLLDRNWNKLLLCCSWIKLWSVCCELLIINQFLFLSWSMILSSSRRKITWNHIIIHIFQFDFPFLYKSI